MPAASARRPPGPARGAVLLCVLVPLLAALIPAAICRGAEPAAERVVHLPPGAFAEGGVPGGLELTRCSVVLADGEMASVLRVSPAMAERGFPGLAFTFPPYRREYDLGLGWAAVRGRIPGADPGNPSTTIQSTSFDLRVAGTHLVLTVRFESAGPEFVGEYAAEGPLTGSVPWRRLLDIQADDLVVTADFNLFAQGLLPAVGEVTTTVDFSFAVAAFGSAPVAIESDELEEHIAAAARDGLRALFSSPGFRGGLSAALGALVLGDPSVAGLPVRRIELAAAADGGLDVRIFTAAQRRP